MAKEPLPQLFIASSSHIMSAIICKRLHVSITLRNGSELSQGSELVALVEAIGTSNQQKTAANPDFVIVIGVSYACVYVSMPHRSIYSRLAGL